MVRFGRTAVPTRFVVLTAVLVGLMAAPALAQSGHFVQTQKCTDIGTQVQCSGKVAGLEGRPSRSP